MSLHVCSLISFIENGIGKDDKMAKADLHVHSIYSERPSNWFLQRIGASESYTSPDYIFNTAIAKGMDFVTVTDHNRMDASLYLKDKYPDKVFTGVESTAYFPEDNCKIHVLLYGISEKQFSEVQKIRKDIYQLRDFIKENRIAHSVAHATYSINGKISMDKLERLVLLFDVFEGINGGRSLLNNAVWTEMLGGLNPSLIADMYSRHRIEPFGDSPWIKSFTGGSDDHAGLFIGKAFTQARGATTDEFLESIRSRSSSAEGSHNDYKSLAFTIYKIAYDFSMSGSSSLRLSNLARLGEAVLKKSIGSECKGEKAEENTENAQIRLLISALAEDLASKGADMDTDRWLDRVYDRITTVSDEFFGDILLSMVSDTRRGNFDNFIRNISSMLPGIFLSVPFFMTLRHMNDSRELISEIKGRYTMSKPDDRKILWFTDTFHELNGVAATLREVADISEEKGRNIKIATAISRKSSDPCSDQGFLPSSVIDLSYFLSFTLPYYESIEVRIPSLLSCIKQLGGMEVDEIYISTPGPVGLIGLILSKLINVKCTGIYHTDFGAQAVAITGDESVSGLIDWYIRFFYSFMDEILVPTSEYIDLLEKRGFEKNKMKLFLRAIDSDFFAPAMGSRKMLEEKFGIRDSITLLYVGRISKDKSIDMIIEIHRRLFANDERVTLLLVGDGPYLSEISEKCRDLKGIVFSGRLNRMDLPSIYSACDLLIFPSVTDTFGMVVLEAQACGLPAFVSDIGGPMEIILDGRTGMVLPASNMGEWVGAISRYIEMMDVEPEIHASMKEASRVRALEFGWDAAFDNHFGKKEKARTNDMMKMDFSLHYSGEKPAA